MDVIELRPHQHKAIVMLKAALKGKTRRPILQLATGAGKTRIAARIIELARQKGNRVLFLVPALSLIDQTGQEFAKLGISEVGVIQGMHPLTDPAMPVQVATVQTLMNRQLPEVELVIVDEAHRWFGFNEQWMAMEEWRNVPFIGLSATPWTKGLGKYYDLLLVAATTAELIEAGYLSPFRVFAPSHPDLTGVRTVGDDYDKAQLSAVMSESGLVADVVENWRQHGEDRPTLCFAVDRAHAKRLQAEFAAAGIPTDYVDCNTPPDECEAIRVRFAAGTTRVVCNVGVLTTGVDWDVRCIILARPTKSEMLYTQIIGRGLRTAEGKQDCLIFDHSETTLRLGFVTDIHHAELDDGKQRAGAKAAKNEALPKECPSCHLLKQPKVHACPACGFKPAKQSDIECEDGELVEVKGRKPTMDEKLDFLGQLLSIVHEKGYRRGWAANQYRERFGVWPPKAAASARFRRRRKLWPGCSRAGSPTARRRKCSRPGRGSWRGAPHEATSRYGDLDRATRATAAARRLSGFSGAPGSWGAKPGAPAWAGFLRGPIKRQWPSDPSALRRLGGNRCAPGNCMFFESV